MNESSQSIPDPRRAGFGKGGLIRGRGASRHYGHVEVSVEPDFANSGLTLHWAVPEDRVPTGQHAVIMAAARGSLERFVSRQPICGVNATITDGTWLGDAVNDLYAEAVEMAIHDAIRDARVCTLITNA